MVRVCCSRTMSYARRRRLSDDIENFEVVALEALTAASVGTLEDGQGEAEELVNMHLDGANPVASLTELLRANATRGKCTSQSFCRWLTTIASIWALV